MRSKSAMAVIDWKRAAGSRESAAGKLEATDKVPKAEYPASYQVRKSRKSVTPGEAVSPCRQLRLTIGCEIIICPPPAVPSQQG
jgi:hypothetical protein